MWACFTEEIPLSIVSVNACFRHFGFELLKMTSHLFGVCILNKPFFLLYLPPFSFNRLVGLIIMMTYTVLLYGLYVPDWEYEISVAGSAPRSFSVSVVILCICFKYFVMFRSRRCVSYIVNVWLTLVR